MPPETPLFAIEIRALSRRHGAVVALEGVDLTVEAREAVGLIGRSGCGRSTLLGVLSTLVRPTSGSAHLDGIDVATQPLEVRRRIGIVPQTPSFPASLTVRESLELSAAARLGGKQIRREAVDGALRWTLLPGDELIERLPRGQRQLLALASARLATPAVLLLDEPLVHLDPLARQQAIEKLLASKRSGAALVLASSRVEDLASLCDRVALMRAGRIVDTFTVETADALERTVLRRLQEEADEPVRPAPLGPRSKTLR